MIWRLAVAVLLWAAGTAQAATYYVATTGNDANDGSSGSPYRTMKRCTQAPTAPGDTCIVRDGTYVAADIGRTDYALWLAASQGSVAGTSGSPITLKSEHYLGAVVKVPSVNAGSSAMRISQPYWIIEGFDINGTGTVWNTGASASAAGITVVANNVTIRRNHIWDIARTMCSNSAFGQSGILVNNNVQNTLIEYNRLHQIGRLRNGESGCVTTAFQHDHGIYSAGADVVTIRHNEIYDTNRGYPIHVYTSGATHDGITIVQNTVSGGSPTTLPAGQIILCNTVSNVTIKNNLFHAAPLGYPINYCPGTTATNVVITYNVQDAEDDDATNDMQNPSSKPASGITANNNVFNATLGLANTTAGSENFTLLSTSAAINAGVALGDAFCGSAPDMGAYETCGPASATITGATMEVNVGQAHPPLQPNGTGVSLSCVGGGCGSAAAGAVTLKSGSDSIASIAVTGLPGGVCSSGDTYTVTCSTCGWTDSALVGGMTNQPTLSFTGFAVTNNCAGSPGGGQDGEHELKAIRFQKVYLEGGAPVDWGTGINQPQTVVRHGAVAVLAQIDCKNVSPCTGAAYQWRYSLDGVNFTNIIPNTPTSDGVSMWGTDADARLNRFAAAGCPLSGGLSCAEGETTVTNANSTTARDLAQNSSYTIRAIVRIHDPPSADVYIAPFHSNGNPLVGGLTPAGGAHIVVIDPEGSGS